MTRRVIGGQLVLVVDLAGAVMLRYVTVSRLVEYTCFEFDAFDVEHWLIDLRGQVRREVAHMFEL